MDGQKIQLDIEDLVGGMVVTVLKCEIVLEKSINFQKIRKNRETHIRETT